MKKSHFVFLTLLFCSFFGQTLYAERVNNIRELDRNNNGIYEPGEVNEHTEYQCGPCVCYCPITRFKPKYYCVERCVQEPYTVRKKQCRYVNKYYTKKHCRYVPQYYTKTYCKKVPEYYYTCETKYRNKTVKDRKCRYEPYTCWEKRCIDAPDGCPVCPQNGGQYAQPAGRDHHMNGHKNGHKNGHRNGHENGHQNGRMNGHNNGHGNGQMNGGNGNRN